MTTDEGHLDVVNPDEISAGKSNSIATPDILWVELGDVDVSVNVRDARRIERGQDLLNDDVLGTVCDAETLSSDDTRASNANKRFV